MEKFIRFTIFHSIEQKDIRFDVIISEETKKYSIITNHLVNMEKDFISIINNNYFMK